MKNGIKLHVINKDKFKTNVIAIFLSTPLTRESVTKNAVLSSVLRRGCKKYKTQEEISKRLEEMYGAEFDSGLDKIGKNHVLKFYIESINDEFLPKTEENVLKESIEMLTEIIFNPLIKNDGFDEEYINQEKQNIKQIIEAKKDNKATYAIFRCMEEMYKNAPEGLYKFGYVEDLENIDSKTLYNYYKELIKNCKIDIFVSGNIEENKVIDIIENNENIKQLNDRTPIYNINKPKKKEETEKENMVEEAMEVVQGKMVLGYDVLLENDDKKNRYIGMVYNSILGGSASSKMFQNVREKESLAYTASSNYAYASNHILIMAGIEICNFNKALELTKKQVEDMKKGNFNDEDIQNAKKTIISGIKSIDDEQDTEVMYFLGQELINANTSLEEYISLINNVNRDEIIDFANKVKLNTVYFLKN